MKSSKAPVLLAVAVLLGVSAGPTRADDYHQLLTDIQIWHSRGLVRELPPLRPYPIQLIRSLLEEVEADGDPDARARAAAYMAELTDPITAHIGAQGTLRSDLATLYQQYSVAATVQGTLRPDITYSGELAGVPASDAPDSLLPAYQRPDIDVVYDRAVAPIGSTGLTPRIAMTGSAAFGTDTLYFQAGITRASYGPFWGDSIVLSPTAPQAGQFSLVVRQPGFSATMALLDIAATLGDGSGPPLPNKFLSIHSIEIYPTDWLTLGIFESVVWGNRLEPLYLLPLPSVFIVAQGLVGYPDNSFLGLSGSVRLPHAVSLDALLYVDDAGFNELIKLNFNTMYVLSGQAGASWTPHLPFLERLGLEYTMVTPYMYSHIEAGPSAPNYQNYTNNGQNMGTSIPPDSDRVELTAMARPFPWLDVDVFARFIRHGNGSEGIPGGGDGSVYDDGFVNGVPTFTPTDGYVLPDGILYWTRFMTQASIERTLQLGVNVKALLRTAFGTFTGGASYTFQRSWNYQLQGVDTLSHYIELSVGYEY